MFANSGVTTDPDNLAMRERGARVMGPQFGETVYIAEVYKILSVLPVNRARKIKSDVQVATYKNSNLVQKIFLRGS